MGKQNIGVTSNGIQEKCRWNKTNPCPRHRLHSTSINALKGFKVISLDEPEHEGGITFEEYNNQKPLLTSKSELSEDELMFLKRFRFVEVDGIFYRFNNNGSTLDNFRMINNIEDFTEAEFNQLIDSNLLVIDEVEYSIETDSIGVERLEVLQKDVDAPYLRLENWLVESAGINVPDYIKNHGGQENILDYDLEQAYMNGGCAVYALAFQELNPKYQLAMETFEGASDGITYNHVFCINPDTGEAYDARGRFASPEALYDYASDHLTSVNPTNTGTSTHEIWDVDQLKELIDEGFFTYDDTDEDIFLTKQLIKKFKPRFI